VVEIEISGKNDITAAYLTYVDLKNNA